METKVVVFSGGPFHNQYRELPVDYTRFYCYQQESISDIKERIKTLRPGQVLDHEYKVKYYERSGRTVNGTEVFTYVN